MKPPRPLTWPAVTARPKHPSFSPKHGPSRAWLRRAGPPNVRPRQDGGRSSARRALRERARRRAISPPRSARASCWPRAMASRDRSVSSTPTISGPSPTTRGGASTTSSYAWFAALRMGRRFLTGTTRWQADAKATPSASGPRGFRPWMRMPNEPPRRQVARPRRLSGCSG
jgi:hypothetical protein